ncbi:MAG: AraC family transcriptional regulator [Actinomycetota bacterium]|nr:AraC family transcriptional regulator [Actinomycetota bacterium]
MVRRDPGEEGAIVRPSAARERFSLDIWLPEPPLDRFVARFWKTAWALDEPFVQTIVGYPAVNLVVQADRSITVTGPQHHNDERRLDGAGWAFGARFRAGGFRPFVGLSLAGLADRALPATELFGDAAAALADAVVDATDDDERLGLFVAFLAGRAPVGPTDGERLSSLLESAAEESPPVTRVGELAERFGVSARTLQRLFLEHVGMGPKWCLDRARVHAVSTRTRSEVRSWADVAHELGYADQAHLTTSFSSVFGAPPAAYTRHETDRTGPADEAPRP